MVRHNIWLVALGTGQGAGLDAVQPCQCWVRGPLVPGQTLGPSSASRGRFRAWIGHPPCDAAVPHCSSVEFEVPLRSCFWLTEYGVEVSLNSMEKQAHPLFVFVDDIRRRTVRHAGQPLAGTDRETISDLCVKNRGREKETWGAVQGTRLPQNSSGPQ